MLKPIICSGSIFFIWYSSVHSSPTKINDQKNQLFKYIIRWPEKIISSHKRTNKHIQ